MLGCPFLPMEAIYAPHTLYALYQYAPIPRSIQNPMLRTSRSQAFLSLALTLLVRTVRNPARVPKSPGCPGVRKPYGPSWATLWQNAIGKLFFLNGVFFAASHSRHSPISNALLYAGIPASVRVGMKFFEASVLMGDRNAEPLPANLVIVHLRVIDHVGCIDVQYIKTPYSLQ